MIIKITTDGETTRIALTGYDDASNVDVEHIAKRHGYVDVDDISLE